MMIASDMANISPTDSTSTNKGGRPLDWTAQRTRKLTRLYLFTKLCLKDILILMETHDRTGWKPTESAARKTLNRMFGYGPRWVRPNNPEEQLKRFGSLKRSERNPKAKLQRRSTALMDQLDPPHEEVNSSNDPIDFISQDELGNTMPALDFFSYDSGFGYDPHMPMLPRAPTRQFTFSDYCPPAASQARVDTGFSDSTTYTVATDVLGRLSNPHPPNDSVKDAMRLLKRFTLSNNNDTPSPGLASSGFRDAPFSAQRQPTNNGPFYAGLAVPSDFLNIDVFRWRHQCQSTPEKAHQTEICWCKIEDALVGSAENSWPLTALDPWDISALDSDHLDEFGNSIFHFLASRDGFQSILAERAPEAALAGHELVSRKNTAGQTFLHALHDSWYEDGQPLSELIISMHQAGFDILATDVYGRNCFHHMKRHNVIRKTMEELVSTLNLNRLQVDRRDAFGCKPLASFIPPNSERNPSRLIRRVLISNRLNPLNPTRLEIPSSTTVSEARIQEEAGLLRVITTALAVDRVGPDATSPNPHHEDAQGRNGLHCLAEAILGQELVAAHAFGTSPVKKSGSKKRKRGAKKEEKQSEEEDPLLDTETQLRGNFIKGLESAGVDPEAYDCQGYTPLMKFVERREDGERVEQKSLEYLLETLIACSGSGPERQLFLERRNRKGETALHVAVRLGKIHAVRYLLKAGANPNTRNYDGLGLLEVINRQFQASADNDSFSARMEACRALLTGSDEVSSRPTVVDEWRRRGKL